MNRRDFIALLGGAAAGWPLAARAQQAAMPVIGMLNMAPIETSDPQLAGFRKGAAEAGFVDGQNVKIEFRSAQNQIAPFRHNLRDRAAAFRSTRLRHDAESAVHVASLHDRDKSRRLPGHQLLVANGRLRTDFFIDINDREPQIVHRSL